MNLVGSGFIFEGKRIKSLGKLQRTCWTVQFVWEDYLVILTLQGNECTRSLVLVGILNLGKEEKEKGLPLIQYKSFLLLQGRAWMCIRPAITAHRLTRKPFVSFSFCFVHFLLSWRCVKIGHLSSSSSSAGCVETVRTIKVWLVLCCTHFRPERKREIDRESLRPPWANKLQRTVAIFLLFSIYVRRT